MRRKLLPVVVLAAVTAAFFAAADAAPPTHDSPGQPEHIFGSRKKHSKTENEGVDFQITGEVHQGSSFEQPIGHGLIFELVPPSNAADAGWVIEIVPKKEPASEPIEFSAIATPPYHVYNDRILATAYGRSAADVVNLKDRTFFFVHSPSDEHRAEEVVNAAYYPTDLSDQDRVRVATEQHEIQVSKGMLHILKSRTTHSQVLGGPGSIEWIRFQLDIDFSPGLTMANILARVVRAQ